MDFGLEKGVCVEGAWLSKYVGGELLSCFASWGLLEGGGGVQGGGNECGRATTRAGIFWEVWAAEVGLWLGPAGCKRQAAQQNNTEKHNQHDQTSYGARSNKSGDVEGGAGRGWRGGGGGDLERSRGGQAAGSWWTGMVLDVGQPTRILLTTGVSPPVLWRLSTPLLPPPPQAAGAGAAATRMPQHLSGCTRRLSTPASVVAMEGRSVCARPVGPDGGGSSRDGRTSSPGAAVGRNPTEASAVEKTGLCGAAQKGAWGGTVGGAGCGVDGWVDA